MQQWQSQESYRTPLRQRSRGQRSSGWRIFWSTWWMVGALPWLFVVWWQFLLPIALLVLVEVIVLFVYVVGLSKESRRPHRTPEPSVNPSPPPPFYEQGYQGQSRDTPTYHMTSSWDEQPQASYPELESPDV